jgi:DNA-binding MarR family transcriptional regulator
LKLEDEIHQKKFNSEAHKLTINILYTSNWLNSKHAEYFKNVDISIQQYNVLRILRGQYPKPSSVKLVKERMLDKMSDASRIIDKLKLKKLVVRTECPEDRRSVDILITDKGLELLKSLDDMDKMPKELFKNLSSSEIKNLNTLLDKLRD